VNKETINCHNLLNDIYSNCEDMFNRVKKQYKNVKMESYKGHYIRINGKYEYQKYFMPVVSVDGIGDICFNLDGISLEFFVNKNQLLNNCDFNSLLSLAYDVEVYDARDSTIDIYENNMSQNLFIEKLEQWESDLVGVTINCQDETFDEVINIFTRVVDVLGILRHK